MSSLKSLASQTIWYGVSSIASRFINYLLTPFLTYTLTKADYGKMSAMYAAIPLLNVIFTYGMETAYFRFVQQKDRAEAVNTTATISLICSTFILSALLWLNQSLLGKITSLQEFPLLIQLSILIIGFDALSTLPFAKIRNEGRPKLYALIKVCNILLTVGLTIFFLSYCPAKIKEDPNTWLILIYKPSLNPITYVLLANVIASLFTLLMLFKWLVPKKWVFNLPLWKEMIVYALPMLVAGIGWTINETFDRLMLGWWLPHENNFADEQRGIYSACYKLSILISLFIQAFRMGAEPFFFKQASGENAQRTYARVMKFFVITITLMFLVVSLYLPIWKYFISPKEWEGLGVVPVLLLANMSLGIYINLSIWYKVTNNTMAGAWITLVGTSITILVNWLFIPRFSYYACAWATFLCYTSMMIISFVWGQKKYFIPYAWKKLLAYISIVVLLYFIQKGLAAVWSNLAFSLTISTILTAAYCWFILQVEKNEFKQLPVVGKFLR